MKQKAEGREGGREGWERVWEGGREGEGGMEERGKEVEGRR